MVTLCKTVCKETEENAEDTETLISESP